MNTNEWKAACGDYHHAQMQIALMRPRYPIHAAPVFRGLYFGAQALDQLSNTSLKLMVVLRAAVVERLLQSVASAKGQLSIVLEVCQLLSDSMKMWPTRASEQIELLQVATDLALFHTGAKRKHMTWRHYQRLLAETCSLVPESVQAH